MSTRMQKTVVVAVTVLKVHPKYQKRIKTTKRYQAHYAGSGLGVGDVVTIEESRPLSKNKNWVVKEVVRALSKNPSEEQDSYRS